MDARTNLSKSLADGFPSLPRQDQLYMKTVFRLVSPFILNAVIAKAGRETSGLPPTVATLLSVFAIDAITQESGRMKLAIRPQWSGIVKLLARMTHLVR